jgi:hypothetical protein
LGYESRLVKRDAPTIAVNTTRAWDRRDVTTPCGVHSECGFRSARPDHFHHGRDLYLNQIEGFLALNGPDGKILQHVGIREPTRVSGEFLFGRLAASQIPGDILPRTVSENRYLTEATVEVKDDALTDHGESRLAEDKASPERVLGIKVILVAARNKRRTTDFRNDRLVRPK